MKHEFPVTFELKVHLIKPEDHTHAEATVMARTGEIPTKDEVLHALGAAVNMAPEGFRLPTPQELYSIMATQAAGTAITVVGPEKWDGFTEEELQQTIEATKEKEINQCH